MTIRSRTFSGLSAACSVAIRSSRSRSSAGRSSSVTASGAAAAMCSARSLANAVNFSLRATKSVWQLTSTSTPILFPEWM